MTLPAPDAQIPPDLVAAFGIFLGRRPNPANAPRHENHYELNRILARSAEFRASPRAVKTPIGWPLAQVFVSKPAKVIYCPIGKNACTFLKAEVARTAQPAFMNYMARDIHFITDHVRTGLQLSDYPEAEARALATDPAYLRFAVLRDPFDRLLSAYIEKFVLGRTAPDNIQHTRSVVAPVQRAAGLGQPDHDRGISFRQFVSHLETADPARLDPHWRPQALYLAGMDYDRLFRIDELDTVMEMLETRSGLTLGRQARNVTGSGKGTPRPGAMDLLPGKIAGTPRIARASFLDHGIEAAIHRVYAADFTLLGQN